MNIKKIFIFTALAGFLASWQGCLFREDVQELLVLKRIGASQKQISNYLAREDKLFARLLDDIKRGRLRTGIYKRSFIARYGDPVLSKKLPSSAEDIDILLYRYSTKYFTSDKVYAYFDASGKLSHWEYIPYTE
ncbi:MAG: hypothetical protein PHU64_00090 [Candidatus Omnitrophica bacterium]|nr:hypothetical protein [Candidatus Omnitrophota bacterium]MDD5430277.1 hypothetical protein [Candidatus Omnitrophota bacterium]